MDPVSAIAAITSVSGLFSKLYSLGENLIDAKKNFDKFQTWCWLYKVQVALIRKWADENSEAFEKIGKVDTRRLFNKVLKNINRILGSLEKLLSDAPDKSKGNFQRRVGVVSIGSDALKTIETLDGLLSQVKSTMELLGSMNKISREPPRTNGKSSQSFEAGLWDSLEVMPTKDLDIFVANFFDQLNKKVLNEDGERAIHIAARVGNLPILDSLLRHGADTDVIDVDKMTPLHLALRHQSQKAVDKLLDYSDASLSMIDGLGLLPLHIALMSGLENIAIQLIEKSPTTLIVAIGDGVTALHIAADRYLPDVIRKIIQQSGNANINQQTNSGRTALTMAMNPLLRDRKPSDEKKVKSIRLLLQHGADVSVRMNTLFSDSLLALHMLAFQGQIDIMKDIQTSWEALVNTRHELLPDKPASPQNVIREWVGGTALQFAVLGENLETIKLLLDKGADPNIGLSAGSSSCYAPTPLWGAIKCRRIDIAKELLNRGASPNFIWQGRHMVHWVIEDVSTQFRAAVMNLLLSNDADLHYEDKEGTVPLVHAARKGCIASLNALWDAHTKLDLPVDGATDALIEACQKGHYSCVVFLCAKGVDINVKNEDGYTPLHYAARYGRNGVVTVLLPMGADHTIVALTRQEPFEAAGTAEAIARASGHIKTADLIKAWGS